MATYESRRYNTPVPDVTKIADGSVNNTEFETLDGVTSDIQTQLNARLPLAGGVMTGSVTSNDNVRARFGSSNDLQIYHDGSNSIIDNSVGALIVNADTLQLKNGANNATLATFTQGGSSNLRFNGLSKLETTNTGVSVTGEFGATGNITASANVNGNGQNLTNLNASNLATGTVPAARLPGGLGKVLQMQVFTNQTQFSTTSNIPADGSTPTISEGIQVASRTFTPTASNSQLIHVINVFAGGNSGGAIKSFNIFRGNTNIGAFADITGDSGHFHCVMGQTVESSAATTSSITYTLRFGTDNNTVYWNRSSGTNGVTASNPSNSSLRWIIYEIGA